MLIGGGVTTKEKCEECTSLAAKETFMLGVDMRAEVFFKIGFDTI